MPDLIKLDDLPALEAALHRSAEAPVLIFKHSLTCGVSAAAIAELRRFLARRPTEDVADYRLVEVQNARPVSNEIARRTGIRHESPQALLLRDGEVVWSASHWHIRAEELAAAVDEAT